MHGWNSPAQGIYGGEGAREEINALGWDATIQSSPAHGTSHCQAPDVSLAGLEECGGLCLLLPWGSWPASLDISNAF